MPTGSPRHNRADVAVEFEGRGSPRVRSGSVKRECHLCKSHLSAHHAGHHASRGVDGGMGGHTDPRGHNDAENRVYATGNLEEEAKGPAGRMVKKMGILAYILFFVFPLSYVAIFFALVPLGEPTEPDIKQQWVFLFISNPAVAAVVAYLYTATFLALVEEERPFRTSIIPVLGVVAMQVVVLTPLLLTVGTFKIMGIVALGVLYISLYAAMYIAYPNRRAYVQSFFRRFILLLSLFVPLLSGFVIAYRELESVAQAFLSFLFAFVTFVYRRVMLSRLDPFPLDLSQLLAGFWVQNLADLTIVLAFPQVSSPSVYAALFLASASQNILFLGFISDAWIYKLRPAIKTYVLNGIKCNFPIPPIPEPDESFDPVNRGHDSNVGGYRRRQFRFFFFRLLSQAIAMVSYLGISPMLRFAFNKDYTPLGIFLDEEYRNSMMYAAGNLVFVVLVGIFGYMLLHKRHHSTFHEIREIHRHDFLHHTMVGMVIAIITHNLIVTIAIILSHYCIYAAFQKCFLLVT